MHLRCILSGHVPLEGRDDREDHHHHLHGDPPEDLRGDHRVQPGWAKATGADPLRLQITTNNITTDGTLVLTSVSTNSAGTATAPANGDVVYLTISASCDGLNDRFTG